MRTTVTRSGGDGALAASRRRADPRPGGKILGELGVPGPGGFGHRALTRVHRFDRLGEIPVERERIPCQVEMGIDQRRYVSLCSGSGS